MSEGGTASVSAIVEELARAALDEHQQQNEDTRLHFTEGGGFPKVIGDEDSFVAVSDRDEKIQVSCFPSGYNIRTVCLGHNQVPEVLLLSWNEPEAGWSRLQSLDVPCPPDDVAFEEDGQLWVLLSSPASVQLFHRLAGGCWQQRQEALTEGRPAWTGLLLEDVSQALRGSLQGEPTARSGSATSAATRNRRSGDWPRRRGL
ncbi:uncharacterized protein LOC144166695 [Haemaphysalis longicornis]